MNAGAPCAKCGRTFPMHLLDSKPSSEVFRNHPYQIQALCEAADRGEDFDRLECADCYGPGYVALDPSFSID